MNNSKSTPDIFTETTKKKNNAPTGLQSILRSEELMSGKSQVTILHNDELYFLRRTRLGKLILTK